MNPVSQMNILDFASEILGNIFVQLKDPRTFLRLPEVCKAFKDVAKDAAISKWSWTKVEEDLGYRIDPEKSSVTNYRNFVAEIISTIERYPKNERPAEVQNMLNEAKKKSLSGEQVRLLRDFIKARDIVCLWKEVVRNRPTLREDLTGTFNSITSTLKVAERLSDRMKNNKNELKKITSLMLDDRKLSSLPKEIKYLENLYSLDLTKNNLTSLPKEIGKLVNLTNLYLRKNHLTALPLEIENLKELENLFLGSNRITVIPKEIESFIDDLCPDLLLSQRSPTS